MNLLTIPTPEKRCSGALAPACRRCDGIDWRQGQVSHDKAFLVVVVRGASCEFSPLWSTVFEQWRPDHVMHPTRGARRRTVAAPGVLCPKRTQSERWLRPDWVARRCRNVTSWSKK